MVPSSYPLTDLEPGSAAVLEKISRVKNSWDLNHPDYAFRTYLYNSVGKERAAHNIFI